MLVFKVRYGLTMFMSKKKKVFPQQRICITLKIWCFEHNLLMTALCSASVIYPSKKRNSFEKYKTPILSLT